MTPFFSYTLTTLDEPNAWLQPTLSNGTTAYGINDTDQIVGTYQDKASGYSHGFLYNNGTYTAVTGPLGGNSPSTAYGINNMGQIVGSYVDYSTTLTYGHIYTPS